MAEAEEVIVDAARHATSYAQALWRRHCKPHPRDARFSLAEIAPRLDLLITALYGRSYPLRTAQPPAPATLLTRLFARNEGPLSPAALPATDGLSIWLPPSVSRLDLNLALMQYRVMALQQATRISRGSAGSWPGHRDPLVRDLYLLLETLAADRELVRTLPGMQAPLRQLRDDALAARPPIAAFPAALRSLEELVRAACAASCSEGALTLGDTPATPVESLSRAQELALELRRSLPQHAWGSHPLFKDVWLGDLRAPPVAADGGLAPTADPRSSDDSAVRSARLARRPEVRQEDSEDQGDLGAWMIQTSKPHEQAEDPHGLQRPTDHDDATAAAELADALSELHEARLVSTASRSLEVLLSDDPPEAGARRAPRPLSAAASALVYPEWDYQSATYHAQGAIVQLVPCTAGPPSWVTQTLRRYRGMLHEIRRRFELLRARRSRLRKQLEGDELDLEAYLEGYSDFRAGLPLSQAVYQSQRRAHRDMAIMLLVDISGSTDSWVSGNRRIIDVEREALLLVCIALEGLAERYAVQAFSGEGPERVTMRRVKGFDEGFDSSVSARIAGLEPEQYTRVGAAVRHAATLLLREPAQHRLLLLLSDGKPNDVDQYEGRYGVEDLRQAVIEAKLQGISPFCLTIDRQAAAYLPFVFGAGHYALLPRPELLPTVLLDWLRRLLGA